MTDFQRGRIRSMEVKAGAHGTLQELQSRGRAVGPDRGAQLAGSWSPGGSRRCSAFPETQAKDVTIGQPAAIDTRNGIVHGTCLTDRSRGAERHRDGGRLAGGRDAARGPARPLGGRDHPGRAARQRAARRPAGVRPGGQHGGTVQAAPTGGRRGAHQRCGWAAPRSTRSRWSAGCRQGEKVIISDMSRWDGVDRVRVE